MTNRIVLRPIERADLAFLRDLANDAEVRSRVVGWDWPLSLSGQTRWFESGPDSSTTRRFLVESVEGNAIGLTGLWDIDWRNRTAMTALKLGGTPLARGQGFGAEAVELISDFAFNDVGLNRLHSTILATNAPSLAVYLRKCGWQDEGRLRAHVWRNGDYVDVVQVGILRSEFLARSEVNS